MIWYYILFKSYWDNGKVIMKRLRAMKCHTVLSWIPPQAGFKPGTISSKVGSASHSATCHMQHDYVCTYFGPFETTPLALPPGVTSKFQMCSSSPHPSGYYLWQFQGSSYKNLRGVRWQSKKRTQNPTFLPLVTPRHAPGTKFLHHCILLFITFDLICNMTMLVQNEFWTLWATPRWPCPQGSHENSECVPPVLIHSAIACGSFENLALMV